MRKKPRQPTELLIELKNASDFLEKIADHADNHRQNDDQPDQTDQRGDVVAVGFFQYLTDNRDDNADRGNFENNGNIHIPIHPNVYRIPNPKV